MKINKNTANAYACYEKYNNTTIKYYIYTILSNTTINITSK